MDHSGKQYAFVSSVQYSSRRYSHMCSSISKLISLIRSSRFCTIDRQRCWMLSSFSPQPHRHTQCKPRNRGNYCTNMADLECNQTKPWCYTTDPNLRWEVCDIPKCGGELTINAPCVCVYTLD